MGILQGSQQTKRQHTTSLFITIITAFITAIASALSVNAHTIPTEKLVMAAVVWGRNWNKKIVSSKQNKTVNINLLNIKISRVGCL